MNSAFYRFWPSFLSNTNPKSLPPIGEGIEKNMTISFVGVLGASPMLEFSPPLVVSLLTPLASSDVRF
ncbi:MAG: hypothetical protein FJ189_03530 [Gammaproteobacteria bacterium]|nr:hypothetical protein [Gammaproteobacteria bacterium]